MSAAAGLRLDKLVVAGVGLIGGSFALALRAAGVVGTIVGVGRTRENLETAQARGAIDRFVTLEGDWAREAGDADLVLLAAPVAQFPALFATLAPALGPHTLLTDGGSTKQDVVAAARATLGAALPRFVPAHPIAGGERSGAAAANAQLFNERRVIVTPLPETDADAIDHVSAAWRASGAWVTRLSPERHDRVFAAVSHLPHLIAYALVDELAKRPEAAEMFAHAGSGFRDLTRIAASSSEMWRDIALANREALGVELDKYRAALDRLAVALAAGDAATLQMLFARAAQARKAWAASDAYRRASGDDDA
jgi:prephenate dehydrogenase